LVSYVVADLFAPPVEWQEAYGLVVEAYTLQVLPPTIRGAAVQHIARFVAPEGQLLVIARGREPTDPAGQMPWPLTRGEVDLFSHSGLRAAGFDDYFDQERPPVRRFRAVYRREGR
jgi:hypothetical protein